MERRGGWRGGEGGEEGVEREGGEEGGREGGWRGGERSREGEGGSEGGKEDRLIRHLHCVVNKLESVWNLRDLHFAQHIWVWHAYAWVCFHVQLSLQSSLPAICSPSMLMFLADSMLD